MHFFDELCADGLSFAKAGEIAHCLRTELRRDNAVKRLFVSRVVDFAGAPHVVVRREVPPGAELAYDLNIHGLRRAARREMAEEFAVDLAMNHAGTEI